MAPIRDGWREPARLADLIRVTDITIGLAGASLGDAIGQLTEHLVASRALQGFDRAAFLAAVLAREAQISTVLGGGLAVPHGPLPRGDDVLAVMGLSRAGLAVPSPDGGPVHCMVLLATPAGQEIRHLQVLASLARTIGSDATLRAALFAARTPEEAHAVLRQDASDGDVDGVA